MRTTKKQFDYFQGRFIIWCDVFGISDWELYFKNEAYADENISDVTVSLEDKIAQVGLNKNLEKKYLTEAALDKAALHEALHLLLAELSVRGASRYVDEKELTVAEHAVIQRLINFIQSNTEG